MSRILIPGDTTYDIIFKNNKPVDAKVGGSQLNTAVSLGRLKTDVVFISQMGNDRVGDLSKHFLEQNGVDVNFVRSIADHTKLALAFLDENNNADYNFINPIKSEPLEYPEPVHGDIVLFGSSFALKKERQPELDAFLARAQKNNCLIVYDPNFRKPAANAHAPIDRYLQNFQSADIIKGSDEDFKNILNADTAVKAYEKLMGLGGDKILIYTANKYKVEVFYPNGQMSYEVPAIKPISTIGAGDTFNAGILYTLFHERMSKENLFGSGEKIWYPLVETSVLFAQHVCMHLENYVSMDFVKEFFEGGMGE